MERIRFCPKCGERFLTTQEVQARQKSKYLQKTLDNATTEDLIAGHIAILSALNYKILHRENNIVFVLSDEDMIMCPYINGDIDHSALSDVLTTFDRYNSKGLVADSILITASGGVTSDAANEIERLSSTIEIGISTGMRATEESVRMLKENNLL